MQVNGGPITECPVCRYNLDGLPRNYHCPECGFEYEETMRAWRTTLPKAIVVLWILPVMIVCCTALLRLFLRPGKAIATTSMFTFVMLPLSCLINACAFRRMQGFIIVGNAGVFFRFKSQKLVQFRPWHEVRLRDSIWLTDIMIGSPSLPRYLPAYFLRSAERAALRDEIIRRIQVDNSGESPS